jgi:glycosyltransferase involved in cell wall biosynthesis
MIALVSFPRSGNTFFRNLLFELYGLESSTFHREAGRELEENWFEYPVIKTHVLPEELPAAMRGLKVVYIVRDGRDSLVSLAHHRKDLVEPGTDFYINLLEATLALGNSNFGGWSKNVSAWLPKASVVIKYEDLISNPIEETERLRNIVTLPLPDKSRLPSFHDLKFGEPAYGAGKSQTEVENFAVKNFRKGKKGSWREEMPEDIHRLFWDLHRAPMLALGYTDGQLSPLAECPLKKVLIEISKAYTQDNDGVKRYLLDLLQHLMIFQDLLPDWQIDLLFEGEIKPLSEMQLDNLFAPFSEQVAQIEGLRPYEKALLRFKALVKRYLPKFVYSPISQLYRNGPFRKILSNYRMNRVTASLQRKDKEYLERLGQYDLLHVPLPQHFGKVAKINLPKVVTIHDLTHRLFPEYHTEENIRLAEQGMNLANASNAHFIAISQATADDLIADHPETDQRTKVIYEGVSHRFNRSHKEKDFTGLRAKYKLPTSGDFLLSLSTVEPRKNIRHMIASFKAMKARYPDCKTHFYICGKKGWLTEAIFAEEENYREHGIYFTGFVDDLDLPLFYAHARGVCYISHYEGFGLPILEAMGSGTPVIYGDNSSMPEVAGKGGIGVDSRDEDQLIEAMYKLASCDELHTRLVKEAWHQANKFSLLKSAFKTLRYYEEIINHNLANL